jgi:flagellar biosynthesis protein
MRSASKAAALQYGAKNNAPVLVASGMGYMAEKIVEVASDNGVPIYEDDSLATVLTQLQLGQEIPEELYQAIVEIYVYFLHFDPEAQSGSPPAPKEQPPAAQEKPPIKEQSEGINAEEGEK